ncbi:D-sedoheptulose-7-phosphate isomerase [Candidatus Paracaedibacter symbiosus]|uniref:D-sedoheptulose-7-phosphate isomerase n=1 Tax=Candidatus Paracaedibacter symbiosus TaxID=244582 RepID=UPI0005097A3C|nr:SIS domain-containing protein [Candidatus Paracaedibacter symbiosus]
MDLLKRTFEIFEDSIKLKQRILETDLLEKLLEIADVMVASIQQGGKIFFCGNGGSAADAQHLAAELLVRLRSHVNRDAIPALTLATDTSTITACANDYSFEEIFSRPLSGLGVKGDVVVGITTSGKSPNVIKAFEVARKKGIITIGFLGGAAHGDPALQHCDYAFVVPSSDTGRVQEVHITAGHALMEAVEEKIINS